MPRKERSPGLATPATRSIATEQQNVPDTGNDAAEQQPAAVHIVDDAILAEHAAEIRRRGRRVIDDIIEIGKRLTECKALCGHGHWLPWLDREFGWDQKTANNFMHVFEASTKSGKFPNLDLPVSGLYLLAAPSTPDEAREAVIERAERGEPVSVADVKQSIATAKASKPTDPAIMAAADRADQRSEQNQRRRKLADLHEKRATEKAAGALNDPAPISQVGAIPSMKLRDEINAFHRELLGFLTDFTERFNKWHDAGPLIEKDGKAALMQAFYLCADGFAQLAQKLDGRA